jgi:quercetin dioxygenase-like cupin family protein
MDSKDVNEVRRFAAEKMQKLNLYETERMFCDVYCFEPEQVQRPHVHEGSDKIYYVLEGEGTFQVGDERRPLSAGNITMAPSGVEHGVVNDSGGRLVCLVFMAPHPHAPT